MLEKRHDQSVCHKWIEAAAAGNLGFFSYKHVLNSGLHSPPVFIIVFASDAEQLVRMSYVGSDKVDHQTVAIFSRGLFQEK